MTPYRAAVPSVFMDLAWSAEASKTAKDDVLKAARLILLALPKENPGVCRKRLGLLNREVDAARHKTT